MVRQTNRPTNPPVEILQGVVLMSDDKLGPQSWSIIYSLRVFSHKKKTRDRPTNGPTDGPTDRRTDGRTNPLIEMQGCIQKPECLENNDLVYIYGVSFVRILIDERISRRFLIFPSWDPSSARCRICSVRNSTLVHVKQACSHCTGQE